MTLSYEAQAKQHAHAVRMRLMGTPERQRPIAATPPARVVYTTAASECDGLIGPHNVGSETWVRATWPDRVIVIKFGRPMPQGIAPWRVVLREASDKYGVSINDILASSHKPIFVRARSHVIWELRMVHGESLPDIGRLLNRDHTTILHHVKSHAKRRQNMGMYK